MPDNAIGQAYNAAVGQALPIESGTNSASNLWLEPGASKLTSGSELATSPLTHLQTNHLPLPFEQPTRFGNGKQTRPTH